MKKAWLCWEYSDHVTDIDDPRQAQIVFEDPFHKQWARVVEIAWVELTEL